MLPPHNASANRNFFAILQPSAALTIPLTSFLLRKLCTPSVASVMGEGAMPRGVVDMVNDDMVGVDTGVAHAGNHWNICDRIVT